MKQEHKKEIVERLKGPGRGQWSKYCRAQCILDDILIADGQDHLEINRFAQVEQVWTVVWLLSRDY